MPVSWWTKYDGSRSPCRRRRGSHRPGGPRLGSEHIALPDPRRSRPRGPRQACRRHSVPPPTPPSGHAGRYRGRDPPTTLEPLVAPLYSCSSAGVGRRVFLHGVSTGLFSWRGACRHARCTRRVAMPSLGGGARSPRAGLRTFPSIQHPVQLSSCQCPTLSYPRGDRGLATDAAADPTPRAFTRPARRSSILS